MTKLSQNLIDALTSETSDITQRDIEESKNRVSRKEMRMNAKSKDKELAGDNIRIKKHRKF